MNKKRRHFTILLVAFALLPAAWAEQLKVMSFNVRLPSKADGENHWDHRRDLLVRTIQKYDPDVFGTQELFHEQGEYIAAKAPEYKWFGVSRRGNQTDEHMGVFYKPSKLTLLDSGNFWLSETPEVPGSMSWNVSLPRMVTWGLFQTTAGKKFYLYNTHFPHRREDAEARTNCARVIAKRIGSLPTGTPLIVTGDFNTAAESSEPYTILTGESKDAWTTAPDRSGPTGTFNGFKGRDTGPRIDWILYRGDVQPVSAETITYNESGRYPSDHFPVMAVFELK
ncbi:MAG TPA: endonuclease/exonuclease/phosphatase family protein [Bryobacteraceae bacterium]|nr:endonuclease/exonuclease/phosphatase family protein [Bryobacteraceae bacterium]